MFREKEKSKKLTYKTTVADCKRLSAGHSGDTQRSQRPPFWGAAPWHISQCSRALHPCFLTSLRYNDKPRPVLYCMVLPSAVFNGINPVPMELSHAEKFYSGVLAQSTAVTDRWMDRQTQCPQHISCLHIKFLCVWSAAVELTTADCPWCIIDTDSVLCTIEDFSVFQSLQDIIVAPMWQFVCRNTNLLTYLLTYLRNFAMKPVSAE